GPPGTAFIEKKVIVIIINTVSTANSRRLIKYLHIYMQPSPIFYPVNVSSPSGYLTIHYVIL
ncbi:MAG TPA: hypothetical protein DC001_01275, partial [Clostridiales bacterium]|nr:hypothetical protein [Clostridiales bacterium]